MFTPCSVAHWMMIIYERQQRFNDRTANQVADDLVKGCEVVGTVTQNELAICASSSSRITGISINAQPALIKWESGQGNIGQVCCLVVSLSLQALDHLCSNYAQQVLNVIDA